MRLVNGEFEYRYMLKHCFLDQVLPAIISGNTERASRWSRMAVRSATALGLWSSEPDTNPGQCISEENRNEMEG